MRLVRNPYPPSPSQARLTAHVPTILQTKDPLVNHGILHKLTCLSTCITIILLLKKSATPCKISPALAQFPFYS